MIAKPLRIVFDTNVIVSGLIAPGSPSSILISSLYGNAVVLLSPQVVEELDGVFRRPKFDRYQDVEKRLRYLWTFLNAGKMIEVTTRVTDCRDPKDNKFLELALSGQADLIITGDDDLLSLNPWRGIPILTPAGYLSLIW